jgi:hypothetical protein
MTQELGETREALAMQCWRLVSEFANNMKSEKRPFYIVYAAKSDPALQGAMVNGSVAIGGLRQTVKAYYNRPPAMLGIMVWYVDNNLGIFDFVPELSCPPDVPLDESMLSDKSEDQLTGVMEQGKKMNVLVS